jgi:hypothetical protein
MKCPSCDSEDTIKCSVAYETGTTSGSFGGIGINLHGDIGSFSGRKRSQTLFAKSVSPPERTGDTSQVAIALLVVGALAAILGIGYYNDPDTHAKTICILITCAGFLCLAAAIYRLYVDHARMMEAHRRDMVQWARQWVCMRCGIRFEPPGEHRPLEAKEATNPPPTLVPWTEALAAEDDVQKWIDEQGRDGAR